jgi:NADP-dependent 3-hydroxy acid dehydrogenase YdfG
MTGSSDAPLADRTAIVTGASSGIGRATADALARDGASVVLAARRESELAAAADEIASDHGVETLAVPTDVGDHDAVEHLVETTLDVFDGLDVLVNIAGVALGGPIDETSIDDYRTMMATNVDGMFFTTKAALPALRESNGNLILMGSYAGTVPYSRNPVYAGVRWWIRGFGHSIEADAGADGVGVTVINPSEVRTRVWRDEYDEGEILEPETVADAIAYVAEQEPPATVSELDLYRRDKLSGF